MIGKNLILKLTHGENKTTCADTTILRLNATGPKKLSGVVVSILFRDF